MLRIVAEQMSYQQTPYHMIGRTAAIFQQTKPAREPSVIRKGWDAELFGASLGQYVGTGFFAKVGATKSMGRFSPAWLDRPDLHDITDAMPVEMMWTVMEQNFVASASSFRALRSKSTPDGYRRFTFNPLLATPAVSGLGDAYVVPVVGQLLRKISPLGVYYAGVAHEGWGDKFAQDVGDLFEQYIGRQLRQIPNATVHPEIVYGKDNRRSVDWIVVCHKTVILVEVKSVRPTEAVRLGSLRADAEFQRMLGRAFAQVNTTDELIADENPAFSAIPAHLPRVGLIVTMEPFELANAEPILKFQHVTPRIPTNVCWSEDVERLVTLKNECIGEFLAELLANPAAEDGRRIAAGLAGKAMSRNKVLDEAWNAYDWGFAAKAPASSD